jgi:ABC-2 type transport system permease protein
MPTWRPAPIVGALIGDLGRYLPAAALVLGLGFAMGYRAAGGVLGVLAATALVVLFASALSWVWIALGLILRSPTAVLNLGFVMLFPVVFVSNVFVRPDTMPGWLRHIADGNPITHLADAVRGLRAGTPSATQVLRVAESAAVLVALFAPLTGVLYQRRS